MKIINKIQILNSFIALLSIVFFIVILKLYIFLTSLNTVCTVPNQVAENSNNTGKITILILFSLFIILWLDDTRTWHQLGSILFIIATVVTLVSMFYYSTIYPSLSILSFWLFIEWMIIMFRQKENSKNSFHYSFMNV
jgi:phosphatidylglycerophosphate synthase